MSGLPVEAAAIGGGAVAAIAAAAGLLRGRRRRARIDGEAAAMAGAGLPGFTPRAAVVGHDGAAALVSGLGAGGDERVVLVRASGARLTAREVDWGAVRATAAGIVVESGERRVGGVPIAGADALDVRRLAPAASPEAIRVAETLAPLPDISGVVAGRD